MSKRSERREAERLTRKLAYQAQKALGVFMPDQSFVSTAAADVIEPAAEPGFMPINRELPATDLPIQTPISNAQLTANRANAKLSTGPTTPEGQAISSRNALKTGLTGRTVLLPTDDPDHYQLQLTRALAAHQPVGEEEEILVQSIVDTDWRLDRIVTLETGIYTKGMLEFAGKFNDRPAAQRQVLIQTETYLKYEKSLKNLNIQEARLQRQRAKNIAELKLLRQERIRREMVLQAALRTASKTAPSTTKSPSGLENGFDFASHAPAFPCDPIASCGNEQAEAHGS